MEKKNKTILIIVISVLLIIVLIALGIELKKSKFINDSISLNSSFSDEYADEYSEDFSKNKVTDPNDENNSDEKNESLTDGTVKKTSSKESVSTTSNKDRTTSIVHTENQKSSETDLSASEIESLKNFLLDFVCNYWTSSMFSVCGNDKDYSNNNPDVLLSRMLFSDNYRIIEGKERNYNEGTYNGASAAVADAQEVDRVLTEYFNCSEGAIAEMRSAGEECYRNHGNMFYGFDTVVYEDGCYYSILPGVGNTVDVSIEIDRTEYKNGKYYVYYTCVNSEFGVFLSSYDYVAVMDIKQTNGISHWSMYSNTGY